jgi:hypothetical protein
VKNDRDPAEERRAFAAAPTVEELVTSFLDEHGGSSQPLSQLASRCLRFLCSSCLVAASKAQRRRVHVSLPHRLAGQRRP